MPGWDEVPISLAVAASAALPGLFPPVPINGRWYADGALKKTLHASVLLELGLDLVFCLNPLVPFDASRPQGQHVLGSPEPAIPRLVEGGLPVVMSQTFRSLIHSRLELGLKSYTHSHPGTDILLFEPDHRDPTMFLANTFGYRQRRALAEHAYERMRTDLRERRVALNRQLARHGLALDSAVLADRSRRLLSPRAPGNRAARALQRLDGVLDQLKRVVRQCPGQVLPDSASRRGDQVQGIEDAVKPVVGDHDVSRTCRQRGGRAEGDAEVGLGQRWRVVAAVADHGDAALRFSRRMTAALASGGTPAKHFVDLLRGSRWDARRR
jgi:hypothetical protein